MDARISNSTPDAIGLQEPPTGNDLADEQSEQIKSRLASIFGGSGGLSAIFPPDRNSGSAGSIGGTGSTGSTVPGRPEFLLPVRIGTVVRNPSTLPGGTTIPSLKPASSGTSGTGSTDGKSSTSLLSNGLLNPDADYIDASDGSATGSTADSTIGGAATNTSGSSSANGNDTTS
ncbi:MAG: hypothetical protein ACRYHA_17530, partial [Janthinobacterium lividum]